jgi:hypothetical protein
MTSKYELKKMVHEHLEKAFTDKRRKLTSKGVENVIAPIALHLSLFYRMNEDETMKIVMPIALKWLEDKLQKK